MVSVSPLWRMSHAFCSGWWALLVSCGPWNSILQSNLIFVLYVPWNIMEEQCVSKFKASYCCHFINVMDCPHPPDSYVAIPTPCVTWSRGGAFRM